MFETKKLLTYWVLLPPGNVILLLILLGLFLKFKGSRRLGNLSLLVAGVLYLLSTQLVASLLISPLEDRFQPPPKGVRDRCEVIAVLGGGVKVGAPYLDLKNSPNEQTFERVMGAYKLYEEKRRPIIVSGYSVANQISEAEVMKDTLVYFGVNASDILTEGKSRDTYENALFLKYLIDNRTVCLVTSAYHMERALYLLSKTGFDPKKVVPVPVDYKASHAPFTWYQLLPTPYWLNVSSLALHEYFGMLYYLLKEQTHKQKPEKG